jgi:hypothetical protein
MTIEVGKCGNETSISTLIVFLQRGKERYFYFLFWDKINKDNINKNMWLKTKKK